MKKILLLFTTIIIFTACDNCDYTIDSYEVLTGIDIPKLVRINCEYDSERQIKMTVFELEMENFDMDEYLKKYDFHPVDANYQVDFLGTDLLITNDSIFPPNEQLYIRKGRNTKRKKNYQYLIDIKTGKMWGEIDG